MQLNGVLVAGCTTNAATETLADIYLHFLVHRGITDCPKMALTHTVSAPVTGIEIHQGYIFAPKHDLIVTV